MIFKNSINKKPDEAAQQILNNELFVHPSWDTVPIKNGIEWHQDPFKNRTWCFYLHSLAPVNYLLSAYTTDPRDEYLQKAKDIIISWMNSNILSEEASIHAWKDHSAANRVVTLIFFWDLYIDSGLYDSLFEIDLKLLLEKHAEFLYDDNNYNFNNNHGVYQDRALIEISTIFPEMDYNNKWFNKAKHRLMNYIDKFISKDGVHKEHSASYHILMLKLLSGINEFLKFHNKEIESLSEIIYKMEEYLAHIVKPNGEVPMTGDSGPDQITFLRKEIITNPQLLYVRTNGKKGKKPNDDVVYKQDGIAIFRNSYESKNPVYLKFIAAFNSLTHKHADDLSVLLSIGKTDFFVDSGKYNYQEKDGFRKYFRSSIAHNSVSVNRKSYELKLSQINKSKIDHFGIHDEYTYVTGSHTLYPRVTIYRTIIYLKKYNSIIIHDKAVSPTVKTYSQIFNLGKDISVNPITKKKIILNSKIDNNAVELLQLNHVTEFKNYFGGENPIAGWQSSAFNKKHPITQLQFSNKGAEMEYRTIINLDGNFGIKNYSINNERNEDVYSIISKNNKREKFVLK